MAQTLRRPSFSPIFFASQLLLLLPLLVVALAAAPLAAASPTEHGGDAPLLRQRGAGPTRPQHPRSNSGAAVVTSTQDGSTRVVADNGWPSVFDVSPLLDRLAAKAQASVSQWFFGPTAGDARKPHVTTTSTFTPTFSSSDSSRAHRPGHMTEATRRRLADRYAGSSVVRFNTSRSDTDSGSSLKRALADAASALLLDVWAVGDDFVDVRVHERSLEPLLRMLPFVARDGSGFRTVVADLPQAIYGTLPSTSREEQRHVGWGKEKTDDAAAAAEREWDAFSSRREGVEEVFFRDYQPLPVIVKFMRLAEAMYPSIVRMISVGMSYEGREIPALRVGNPPSTEGGQRKTIVVTGGLHAREWISTATVNFAAWSFIVGNSNRPAVAKILRNFDFVFIPVLNPDGYEYTWQVDRLWRKSRQHTNLRFCRGLDLDHAFGYEWDGLKDQSDPCSESYGGDQPFQAVEASQLAQWAMDESNANVEFMGLVDLHSYSQQVLFPYSYSCTEVPPNMENLEELAVGLSKAIRLKHGEWYSVGAACEGVLAGHPSEDDGVDVPRAESGGGSALDWFYHELRARFSYQIKLRDTGSYGFLLPSEYIVPTGEEIYEALVYYGDYVLGNNGIEKLDKKAFGGRARESRLDLRSSLRR